MNNKKIKVFFIAPLVLTAFLSTAYVSADETSSSVQEPTSSQVVSSDTEKTDVSVVTSSTETVTSTTSDTETAVSSEASSQDAQKDGETESSQSSVQTTQSSVASVTQLTPVTPNKSAQLPVADQVVRKGATAGDESSTESTAPVEATVVDNHLVVNYKPTIAADEQVKFAVWSQVNGQDDLVWYDSSAAGAAYIDLSKHRSYGVYNVHTYAFKANQPARGISALTVTLPEPKVETEITQKDASTFAVTVKNVPSTIDAILIPVWSDNNGQDDIKWYTANHVSESTYTVNVPLSEHNNDKGHYDVHVYGHSQLTGGLVGLEVTKGFDNKDTRENAKVAVVDYTENKTTFDVVVSSNENTKPIKAVSVAVWSEDKGQDDLKWYVPTVTNNQAKVTIDIANHSNTSDKYNVHVYTDYADGSRVGQVLGAYQITKTVEKPKVTPTLTDQGISIQLEAKQLSDYTKVRFAVWSEDKGQDDLVWYNSDAKGHVLAPFSQHKGYGIYNIHTYVEDRGHMIGLNATAVDVPKPKEVEVKDPSVSVSRYDKDNGQLDVTVTQGDKEIKYVRVAAWSQDQQANIHWYVTKDITNGKATITVDQSQHKDIVGKYTVHTYVDFADGSTKGFVVGQYDLTKKVTSVLNTTSGSASQGNYNVVNHVIYLDAGHGGKDPGATYFGQTEKALNLAMQELVKSKLENQGYKVITTRTDDTFVDLMDRSKNVNSTNSDLFLSLHFNAGPTTSNGIETYYYEYNANYPSRINQKFHNNNERLSKSASLASAIQEATVAATSAKNNGVQRNTFAVLRETTAPAVLVELGYMSNKEEFSKIVTRVYQEKLANGIVSGINQYYSKL